MVKSLREGDTLIVWKLDRFGRNLRHLVNTIHDLMEHKVGFRLLSVQGANIDTTTAGGRLVFGIFAALAEFERELIRERTIAGLSSARARGRNGGRPYTIHQESCGWRKPPWPNVIRRSATFASNWGSSKRGDAIVAFALN